MPALVLLAASLGLLLGYSTPRRMLSAGAALVAGALIGLQFTGTVPYLWQIFGVSLLVCGQIYVVWARPWAGLTAGLAGLSAGANAAGPSELLAALPALLIALPASWAIRRGWDFAVKVAASWLLATSLLAGALPLVTTPGYVADHRE